MLKLIASDIDGTLLPNGATALSGELFSHIRRLREKGVLFCAASGRQYRSLRALFAPVADDILYLCENGAIVFQDNAVLAKQPLPRADALAIIGQIMARPQCEVLISGAYTSYVMPKQADYLDHIRYFLGNHATPIRRAEEIPEEILKVSAYCRDGAQHDEQLLGGPWKTRCNVAIAGEKWLDFTYADKGTGLAALCGALDIAPADTAAFGDNFNDVPMLRLAGRAYLMESAAPALRSLGFAPCRRVEEILASF